MMYSFESNRDLSESNRDLGESFRPSYQPNECYFVRKFHLFSHLRNIIVPEI